MFLEQNEVNLAKADKRSQTLLSWVVRSECEGAVRMLLEWMNLVPRHAANRQSTELFSVRLSELPEPLTKPSTGFDI